MAQAQEKKLMRILCIHGYRQNAQSFREKTGSLRKLLKKYIDCTFITALHLVPPGNMGSAAWDNPPTSNAEPDTNAEATTNGTKVEGEQEKKGDGERGWWFSRADDYFKSTDYSDCDKGFSESAKQVISVLEGENGNFDGIIGFSQGATLVSMLCSMQQQQQKQWFKFAVLVSGFKSPSTSHDVYYNESEIIKLPTLHMYGQGDQVVSWDRSEALSKYFENPKHLIHPGGHFVAATGAQKPALVEFFDEMKLMFISKS